MQFVYIYIYILINSILKFVLHSMVHFEICLFMIRIEICDNVGSIKIMSIIYS